MWALKKDVNVCAWFLSLQLTFDAIYVFRLVFPDLAEAALAEQGEDLQLVPGELPSVVTDSLEKISVDGNVSKLADERGH